MTSTTDNLFGDLADEDKASTEEKRRKEVTLHFNEVFKPIYGIRMPIMVADDIDSCAVLVGYLLRFISGKGVSKRGEQHSSSLLAIIRVRKVVRAARALLRFIKKCSQTRALRITGVIEFWEQEEAKKRKKMCLLAKQERHNELKIVAQDYTQNFVPQELKYQVTKALYFERHAAYNSEYQKYFDKLLALRRELDDYKAELMRLQRNCQFSASQVQMKFASKTMMFHSQMQAFQQQQPVFSFNRSTVTIQQLMDKWNSIMHFPSSDERPKIFAAAQAQQHVEEASSNQPESVVPDDVMSSGIAGEANEGLDVEGPGIPPRLMAILGNPYARLNMTPPDTPEPVHAAPTIDIVAAMGFNLDDPLMDQNVSPTVLKQSANDNGADTNSAQCCLPAAPPKLSLPNNRAPRHSNASRGTPLSLPGPHSPRSLSPRMAGERRMMALPNVVVKKGRNPTPNVLTVQSQLPPPSPMPLSPLSGRASPKWSASPKSSSFASLPKTQMV
uniref:Uncharacterized protein n=1 Tax=Eutreptiella gymnastica TaxID=73025 RepID=A0A7S1HVA0_9EUGL